MKTLKKNIESIAAEIASLKGLLLIDVNIRGNENNKVIEIFIDGEQNISAADCADFSRDVNSRIETENLITSRYRLDVSSPGVDRPLIFPEQFPKHVNRNFEVTYKLGEQKKKFKGKLLSVNDNMLTFKTDKELILNFNDIIKAKVIISFS